MTRGTTLLWICASGAAFLGLILAGCQPAPTDSPSATGTNPPVEIEAEPSPRERAIAAKDELFGQLSERLMNALEAGDAASAISVCKEEAPRIARKVSQSQGVRIGRTSFRLRNPENTAPAWAESMVEQQLTEPQFVDLDDGSLGALLPITLQPLCMTCHGPQDQIADEVKAALARHYPDDQATGFQAGDLRGWFWIEVPSS
jgi:hypothetical protein